MKNNSLYINQKVKILKDLVIYKSLVYLKLNLLKN